MTNGMRRGLIALCVAAIAGIVALVASYEEGSKAAGVYSLSALVFLLAGIGGLVTVAVALARSR